MATVLPTNTSEMKPARWNVRAAATEHPELWRNLQTLLPLWEGAGGLGAGVSNVARPYETGITITGTTAPTWTPTETGHAVKMTAGNDQRIEFTDKTYDRGLNEMTVLARVRVDTLPTSDQWIAGMGTIEGATRSCWFMWFDPTGASSGNTDTITFLVNDPVGAGLSSKAEGSTGLVVAGKTITVVGRWLDTPQHVDLWADGVQVAIDTLNQATGMASDTTYANAIGLDLRSSAKDLNGSVEMYALWDRRLTDAEASLVSADPYVLLRPARRILVTSTTRTGTLAVTEQADSLAASGTVTNTTFTGTLAVTEQADTLAASGTFTAPATPITGTLAVTEQPDQISAGTQPVVTKATAAEVIGGVYLNVQAGLELYDKDSILIGDISDDLVDGTITFDNTRKIGGTANLSLSLDILWESQQLKPYLTLYNEAGDSYRYDMGVYLPDEPSRIQGESPQTFKTVCYDRTSILDTPYGATLRIASGTGYLASVETLLGEAGIDFYTIDQTQVAATLPTDFVWSLDEKNTYLKIVNDLLLGVNYTEIYADRNGYLVAQPYTYPQDASVIWTYDEDSDTTIIVEGSNVQTDLHEIPNKWVFVRDDPAQALPSAGAGIYTVTNQSDGITSIDSRGRTITKVMFLNMAADQTALEAIGDRIVNQDKQPRFQLSMQTGPNPTHWHYDTVIVNAPTVGLDNNKFFQQSWTLPLDGKPMRHTFRQVL